MPDKTPLYIKEFGHLIEQGHALTVPEILLSEAWQDWSWHNDTTPSFVKPGDGLVVYVDFDDPLHREFESAAKYCICYDDPESLLEGIHCDPRGHIEANTVEEMALAMEEVKEKYGKSDGQMAPE